LFRGPFLPLTLDPHDFQPVEASSDAFYYDATINMPHDMAIRLKLPFSAFMDSNEEPIARPPLYDASDRVKRA
jgi:hypothetical protein